MVLCCVFGWCASFLDEVAFGRIKVFGIVFFVVVQKEEIVGSVNLGFVRNGWDVVVAHKVGLDLGSQRKDGGGCRVDNADGGSGSHGKGWGVNNGEERLIHSILGHNVNYLLVVIGSLDELDTGVQRTSVGFEHDLDGFDSILELKGLHAVASVNDKGLTEVAQSLDDGSLSGFLVSAGIGVFDIGNDAGSHGEFHRGHVFDGDRVVLVGSFQNSREREGQAIIGCDLDAHRSRFGSLPDFDGAREGNSLVIEHDGDTVDVIVHDIPGLEALSSLDVLDRVSGGEGRECPTDGTLRLSDSVGGGEIELLEASNDGLGFGCRERRSLCGVWGGGFGQFLEGIEAGGLG